MMEEDDPLLFPTLAWLQGVKRVKDTSKRQGLPAVDVEFADDIVVTVMRDGISPNDLCICFPPTGPGSLSDCAPGLSREEVLATLNDLAAVSANKAN